MLGRSLVSVLKQRMHPSGTLLLWGRDQIDITHSEVVMRRITEATPNVVINCAAYTDVDGCESNAAKAAAVNGDGPAQLGAACAKQNSLLVHFSTDFVFDGNANTPYRIDDQPNPLSVYGRFKLKGELGIQSSGCRHLIIRTSWLYGFNGKNFVGAILGRAEKGEPLKVVNDQVGRPTFADDLSQATTRLIDAEAGGLVHFANGGSCTWYEYAVEIVHRAGCPVPVQPISSAELGRPARRPAYSVLDLSTYELLTGNSPRHWTVALNEFLRQRKSGERAA